jgi:hypothetical protein
MKAVHKPLNVRQEKFAQMVAGGMPAIKAYVEAGYTADPEKNAVQIAGNRGVAARIAELRAVVESKGEAIALLTIEEKRRFLAELIRTPIGNIGPESPLCQEFSEDTVAGGSRGQLRRGNAPSGNEVAAEPILRRKVKMADKLRAIDLDSKLAGHFKPEELVIETGPQTLASIEARAAAVVSALNRRAKAKA